MSGWSRLGRLFTPPENGLHRRLLSHAANPLAYPLSGDVYRVFFNGRDAANRSAIGAVDIDLAARCVVRVHDQPFAIPPDDADFCRDGLSLGGWIDRCDGRHLMFMGWRMLADGRWRGSIGRLRLASDGAFGKEPPVQVLAPDGGIDPASLSYPCVIGSAGDGYRMWYESTLPDNDGPPLYPLHSAASTDGIDWLREGVALAPVAGVTRGYSRPTVIRADRWLMWFSQLGPGGERYRIGHATSADGRRWSLADGGGLDPAGTGWESEMVCYPHVFEHGGERYMLYNGNDYGRAGFGLAIWRET